eukprot:TRINITY_DN8723_c0_g1_i1.p1 TRINITY_DN8723_c0_g1~~TRINITY_DN8723_c0_g1_i1.p1  ORF type:complete len:366 (+),score=88.21 TRINITY_DN8723_c0_g1_i1:75-1172(+)
MAGCERPSAAAAATCLENLRQYAEYTTREISRVKRNLEGLSDDDKASLVKRPEEQVKAMEESIAATAVVLEKLAELLRKEQAMQSKEESAPTRPAIGIKPVTTLLQTLVREWSADGLEERKECFDKVLGALDTHLKDKQGKSEAPPRVMIPGCSVGRLAFEVASMGYSVEACDARAMSWFGMELMRQTGQPKALCPQPFAVNTCNRLKYMDNHRVTAMPDVAITESCLPQQRFGDFARLYDKAEEKEKFDCLLTAYAVDLAPNVFRFVRTAAHLVKPGGLWANFGPLCYDADHEESLSHGLELSWEELKYAISHFFEVQEEEWVNALHAQNALSLMQMQYTCIYFKAIRNTTPAPGIGESTKMSM